MFPDISQFFRIMFHDLRWTFGIIYDTWKSLLIFYVIVIVSFLNSIYLGRRFMSLYKNFSASLDTPSCRSPASYRLYATLISVSSSLAPENGERPLSLLKEFRLLKSFLCSHNNSHLFFVIKVHISKIKMFGCLRSYQFLA